MVLFIITIPPITVGWRSRPTVFILKTTSSHKTRQSDAKIQNSAKRSRASKLTPLLLIVPCTYKHINPVMPLLSRKMSPQRECSPTLRDLAN